MATTVRNTITLEEFDKRLEDSNARLRQELAITQERVQRLEALLARKEAFSTHLEEVLIEIKREEDEIAALETGLRTLRPAVRQPGLAPQKSP